MHLQLLDGVSNNWGAVHTWSGLFTLTLVNFSS